MELTSLYVHSISIGAPRVKGRERAEPKQQRKKKHLNVTSLWSEKSGVAYPQGFAETLSLNISVFAVAGASHGLSEQSIGVR